METFCADLLNAIGNATDPNLCLQVSNALIELFKQRIAFYYPSKIKLENATTTLFRLLVDGAFIASVENKGRYVEVGIYGFPPGARTMLNPAYFSHFHARLEVEPQTTTDGTMRLYEQRLRDGSLQLIHVATTRYYFSLHDGLEEVGFY